MESIFTTLSTVVGTISFVIGLIGVIVILVGVLKTVFLYCFQHEKIYFGKLRLILNTHLILGLDFFIGKDIIDTFLMDSKVFAWQDLLTLIVVIAVRIVLTHFLEKEIENIKEKETEKKAVLES